MSDERKKMEVGIGEKGTPPEGAEIIDLIKPEEDEVGGRYRRWTTVICPYCRCANDILEETEYRMWFRCWNCGGAFQY
jgi:hypothetical protein